MRKTELSETKRALLEKYLRGNLAHTTTFGDVIPRRGSQSQVPLSFSQQQVWLLAQLLPDIPFYNECVTIHLPGSIDIPALEQSFSELLRRHEAWRTSFPVVNDQPIQFIHPAAPWKLPVTDLRHLPESQRESEAIRQASVDARLRFDLARGPLLRSLLVRVSDEMHLLFLTLHHIIFDGFSIYQVFLPELQALYQAFSSGQPASLPELPVQYADFAAWQRQSPQENLFSGQLAYWKKQLRDAPAILELPSDRPRPLASTYRGSLQPFALSGELSEALRSLGHREDVSLYMLLLAAFNTLLYRYTGQVDLLVGTVTGGRSRVEVQNLLGVFTNTLVMRTDLSDLPASQAGFPTFREMLARVRNVVLEAQAHSDVPFEYVVKELQPERNRSHNPLFQVLLVLEPQHPALSSGWFLTHMDARTNISKFDLSLILEDRSEGIIGRFEYSTDLFDEATILRMIGNWQALLEGIVANPGQRLDELPLLTEAEREQLLVEWNATAVTYPAERPVHQLFEEQAARTPEAIAAIFGDQQLTYQELNAGANQLAHRLQELGVRPEILVGLFLHNSLEMVVGILSILKAGGAYVPLDPTYPTERLAFMLQDAEVSVLLTQNSLLEQLPDATATVFCLDSDWPALSGSSTDNPDSPVGGQHLAYVIYTSGSTGRPKGVAITHQNLWHSTQARLHYYALPVTRYLLLSSIAFDSSVAGIFWTLCQGGTLLLPSETVVRDPYLLSALIETQQPSHTLCVPSLYALLLEQAGSRRLDSLHTIIVAGERCPKELVERHWQSLLNSDLYNEYGPTETTVWCTVYRFDRHEQRSSVPIGHPIANMQAYILDAHLQPVPSGVAGELYIGGPGLARAYLHQPELTAERFIPHPFVDGSPSLRRGRRMESVPAVGARLYKTGDLVRYLPDGNIEFLDRVDQQVKIRGYRIEPGEIEEVLRGHPLVRETVVVVREDRPGDRCLVAYIVLQEQSTAITDLQKHAMSHLPAYMVPSAFVILEALPLMPNGKVSRRGLPAPEREQRQTASEAFVAPRTQVEEILAGIWSRVLGIDRVGIQDDFFALGGHSLLAIQVASHIRAAMQIELPLRSFFEAPTIAGLSQIISELKNTNAGKQLPTIRSISREAHRVTLSSITKI